MGRKLMSVLTALCLSAAMAAVAVAAPLVTGRAALTVTPRAGTIHTVFTVRFAIPEATGVADGVDRSDSVFISGPSHKGCVGGAEVPLRAAPAHTVFRLELNPSHLNGHWCSGTFSGRVVQRETKLCGPGPVSVCPQAGASVRTIARFRFRVAPPPKSRTARG